MATIVGRGVGARTGSGKMKYKSAEFYESNSTKKFAYLNRLRGVNYYELDEMSNYTQSMGVEIEGNATR